MDEITESDHKVVVCMPSLRIKRKSEPIYSLRCTTSHNNKVMLAHALQQIHWEPLYHLGTCLEQFEMYHTTMMGLLDEHLPLKYMKINTQDKPWVTSYYLGLMAK